jgi:AbrB family looped-hinge helix DNA binding protein
MQDVVSITSQGQLTIPKAIRKALGITGPVKATVRLEGDTLVVEPKADFWALSGSLKSGVKLSDAQLRRARDKFSDDWGKKNG